MQLFGDVFNRGMDLTTNLKKFVCVFKGTWYGNNRNNVRGNRVINYTL